MPHLQSETKETSADDGDDDDEDDVYEMNTQVKKYIGTLQPLYHIPEIPNAHMALITFLYNIWLYKIYRKFVYGLRMVNGKPSRRIIFLACAL